MVQIPQLPTIPAELTPESPKLVFQTPSTKPTVQQAHSPTFVSNQITAKQAHQSFIKQESIDSPSFFQNSNVTQPNLNQSILTTVQTNEQQEKLIFKQESPDSPKLLLNSTGSPSVSTKKQQELSSEQLTPDSPKLLFNSISSTSVVKKQPEPTQEKSPESPKLFLNAKPSPSVAKKLPEPPTDSPKNISNDLTASSSVVKKLPELPKEQFLDSSKLLQKSSTPSTPVVKKLPEPPIDFSRQSLVKKLPEPPKEQTKPDFPNLFISSTASPLVNKKLPETPKEEPQNSTSSSAISKELPETTKEQLSSPVSPKISIENSTFVIKKLPEPPSEDKSPDSPKLSLKSSTVPSVTKKLPEPPKHIEQSTEEDLFRPSNKIGNNLPIQLPQPPRLSLPIKKQTSLDQSPLHSTLPENLAQRRNSNQSSIPTGSPQLSPSQSILSASDSKHSLKQSLKSLTGITKSISPSTSIKTNESNPTPPPQPAQGGVTQASVKQLNSPQSPLIFPSKQPPVVQQNISKTISFINKSDDEEPSPFLTSTTSLNQSKTDNKKNIAAKPVVTSKAQPAFCPIRPAKKRQPDNISMNDDNPFLNSGSENPPLTPRKSINNSSSRINQFRSESPDDDLFFNSNQPRIQNKIDNDQSDQNLFNSSNKLNKTPTSRPQSNSNIFVKTPTRRPSSKSSEQEILPKSQVSPLISKDNDSNQDLFATSNNSNRINSIDKVREKRFTTDSDDQELFKAGSTAMNKNSSTNQFKESDSTQDLYGKNSQSQTSKTKYRDNSDQDLFNRSSLARQPSLKSNESQSQSPKINNKKSSYLKQSNESINETDNQIQKQTPSPTHNAINKKSSYLKKSTESLNETDNQIQQKTPSPVQIHKPKTDAELNVAKQRWRKAFYKIRRQLRYVSRIK